MILDSRHLEKTTLATVGITTSFGFFEEVSGTGSVIVMVEASLKEELVMETTTIPLSSQRPLKQ